MLDLSSIPIHFRSKEAHIFYFIKKFISIEKAVPVELKKQLEKVLLQHFSGSNTFIGSDKFFYRARVHKLDQKNPFDAKSMGAPPAEYASSGRIQSAGNPVLYTAVEADTAIAEIRPSVGHLLTIAKFSPNSGEEINILNLTNYKYLKSKVSQINFLKEISNLSNAIRFSEQEFSKKVDPNDSNKYLDTIYISQILRDQGFDGVAYRSLLNLHGVNYAFFTPTRLTCQAKKEVREVTSI